MLTNFPKIHSPFIRKTFKVNKEDWKKHGRKLQMRTPKVYLVVNEINPGYEWVFESENVFAVEKLDGCLYYDTRITTDKGSIQIGKIVNQHLDVKVLSYNLDKQITEFKKIKYYHKEINNRGYLIVKIKTKYHGTNPKQLVITPNHKFWTNCGWKRADELKNGETLFHLTKKLNYVKSQIILGSLLGDSSIYWGHGKKNCGFNCSHSIKQTNYFDLKIKLLGNLVKEGKGGKGGFPGSKPNRRYHSLINKHISDFLKDKCLIDYKKTVNKKWMDNINPIALSFWYMDDGSLCSKNSKTQKETVSLATNSFSTYEVEILQKRLLNFGIESNIQNSKESKGNVLRLTSNGSVIFFNLIAPYIIKEMQYKLPVKFHTGISYWDDYIYKNENDLIETEVINVIKLTENNWRKNTRYQYDIEVEGNSNYFASHILVHNTNIKLETKDGRLIALQNRKNVIDPLQIIKGKTFIPEGIFQSIGKGYVEKNGVQAGELIGPKVQGNPYKLDNHLWYPFSKTIKHLRYNSFDEHDRTFNNWSLWFKDYLFSRFTTKKGIKDIFAEGIIIYDLKRKSEHKTYMAKIRRDMFDWFYSDKIEIYDYEI